MEKWEHKLSVTPEGGEKTEMTLAVNLAGLDLNPFVLRGLKDFAANAAKPVRDGDQTADDFVAGFQTLVEMYSRGELRKREGAGKAPVDTTATLAFRYLATVLKKHSESNFEKVKDTSTIPNFTDPPKDKKGNVNFLAWAKLFPAEHGWYKAAYKAVDKTEQFT